MAAFLYWLPDAGLVPDERLLRARGLWPVLGGLSLKARGSDGPGPGAGLLACDDLEPWDRLCYSPAEQVWESGPEVSGISPFWVGFWAASQPGPAELLRPESCGGHFTRLADGRDWQVPVARLFPEGTALPQTLIMGPGGLSARLRPEYAALSAFAGRAFDAAERGEVLALEDCWRGALEALAVNYRLGPAEVNLLGIFDAAALGRAIRALVDGPTIEALAREFAARKKAAGPGPAGSPGPENPPGSGSSVSGAPGSSPAMSRPTATSSPTAGVRG